MRILLCTPQLPYPPHQGTTIRNYNLIRLLAANHTIDLVTFLAPEQTVSSETPLSTLCNQIIAQPQPERTLRQRLVSTLTQPRPDMALRLESDALYEKLTPLLANAYDVVQVEGIEMAQYGRYMVRALAAQGQRPQFVFDDHNCEYLLQRRNALTDLRNPTRLPAALYSIVQWIKLHRYEAAICQEADMVLAVSEPDQGALQTLAPTTPVHVIANGINPGDYQPITAYRQPISATQPANLVFTGKMDYRPNIDAVLWFAEEVLPLITEVQPYVRFQIVGMNPHPRLDPLRNNPAIEITGAVDEIAPYLAAATVYVVPLRIGGGTRFKVLEAMAQGLPIVSTALGIEGIGITHGRELLVGDSPAAFAEAVLRVLDDRQAAGELSKELGMAARNFVNAHYDWTEIVPRLENLYKDEITNKP